MLGSISEPRSRPHGQMGVHNLPRPKQGPSLLPVAAPSQTPQHLQPRRGLP